MKTQCPNCESGIENLSMIASIFCNTYYNVRADEFECDTDEESGTEEIQCSCRSCGHQWKLTAYKTNALRRYLG